MSDETVARRYATALADVVTASGDADSVRSELKSWEDLIRSNENLRNAFGNPSIAHIKKEGVLEGLLAKAALSRTTANFLRVLLSNSRLMDLDEINQRFESVLEERSGAVRGEVSSAHELSESQRAELKASLEKLTGKRVLLNFTTNKDLIGGVVTRIGSTVYDSSVRTQLENLKEELLNA
jgi:F-type H+-transporting ATPase subunit delta